MVPVHVLFCPRDWRAYDTRIPVYLGGDKTLPYMMLEVRTGWPVVGLLLEGAINTSL